ncbi:MAG: 2-amino-4-hydroxy-6-hydroxymethyldihydropteridine diphosphokinase [Acetobacteraceae bacterium]
MILVAIGANLAGPDGAAPIVTCRSAVTLLDSQPTIRVAAVSRWFETAPVPPSGQPPYVNAVVRLSVEPGVTIDPAWLLARLMEIEAACGRSRSVANAARTLDLDLIAMDNLVRLSPDPILPHPRAHERAFVLAPLADVAPGWIHPVLGRSVEALLAELPQDGIRVLED